MSNCDVSKHFHKVGEVKILEVFPSIIHSYVHLKTDNQIESSENKKRFIFSNLILEIKDYDKKKLADIEDFELKNFNSLPKKTFNFNQVSQYLSREL